MLLSLQLFDHLFAETEEWELLSVCLPSNRWNVSFVIWYCQQTKLDIYYYDLTHGSVILILPNRYGNNIESWSQVSSYEADTHFQANFPRYLLVIMGTYFISRKQKSYFPV